MLLIRGYQVVFLYVCQEETAIVMYTNEVTISMHMSVVSYPASRHNMLRATPPSTVMSINPSLHMHAFVIVDVQC